MIPHVPYILLCKYLYNLSCVHDLFESIHCDLHSDAFENSNVVKIGIPVGETFHAYSSKELEARATYLFKLNNTHKFRIS